jgi:hypothetical protein
MARFRYAGTGLRAWRVRAALCALIALQPTPAPAQAPAAGSRGAAGHATAAAMPAAARPSKAKVRALYAAVVYSLILFIILLAGALAIIRFSRRFRAYVGRSERKPTQNADVWAMHVPPPADPDDEEIEPRDPEAP